MRHGRNHRLEAGAAKNRGVTRASLCRQRLVFPLDYVCPLKRGRTVLNSIVEAQEAITTRHRRGSKANTAYAVYMPHGGQVTVQLQPGRYRATWFSALTGEKIELPPADGPVWTSPVAPDKNDWALLLQAM